MWEQRVQAQVFMFTRQALYWLFHLLRLPCSTPNHGSCYKALAKWVGFVLFLSCFKMYVCMYVCIGIFYMHACMTEVGIRSDPCLWATMELLGIELRTSGVAASALSCWAISPAGPGMVWLQSTCLVFLRPGFQSQHLQMHTHVYIHMNKREKERGSP